MGREKSLLLEDLLPEGIHIHNLIFTYIIVSRYVFFFSLGDEEIDTQNFP